MSEGARGFTQSFISKSVIKMIMCFIIAGVIPVYDKHAWVSIIVGVILMYKELTMSVVPKCTHNNKSHGDLLVFTQCMLRFAFRFISEIPLGTIYV